MKSRIRCWFVVAASGGVVCGAMAAEVATPPTGASAPMVARDPSRIYLQRDAGGRLLLTDRPQDDARTERTWSMEREDPVAARARSDKVALEAQAVSERVQRRIDRDNQIAREAELERQRATASAEADRVAAEANAARYAIAGYWPDANRSRYRTPATPRSDAKPQPPRRRAAQVPVDRD